MRARRMEGRVHTKSRGRCRSHSEVVAGERGYGGISGIKSVTIKRIFQASVVNRTEGLRILGVGAERGRWKA